VTRILLVEDEVDVARFISKGLVEQAYAVDAIESGESALYLTGINTYDVVILDVMIPAPDGLEVCRRLRQTGSTVPILMLTARDSVDDKIAGLDAGADDYLAKPFEFRELLARLRALLRRGGATLSAKMQVGVLEIDTRSHRVTIGGKAVTLTTKEYGVLEFLARNTGRIVSREEISEHVWNQDFDPFSNLIEVYINRLRRHIEKVSGPKLIQTVRGAGYILDAQSSNDACSTPSAPG
jgi:two-component system, OmpR family, copper resistance phosphate regulon response regulator CusR